MSTLQTINFSLFASDDAYSTDKKIMGRQSNGSSFIKAVINSSSELSICATNNQDIHSFAQILKNNQWHGKVKAINLKKISSDSNLKTIYYPAPPSEQIAWLRAKHNPQSFSLMGITHTICSERVIRGIGNLFKKPFENWDGLICTSNASLDFSRELIHRVKDFENRFTGAVKFNNPVLKKIPLGINVCDFEKNIDSKMLAREKLGISNDEIVILSAGRLAFHAKQNPIPIYLALNKLNLKIVFIETGLFPNTNLKSIHEEAQKEILSPKIKHLNLDGGNHLLYKMAWQAADIFISLSDNIQETFGITPLEAMASHLPIIASDWDGYRDNIIDGYNGFLIPSKVPGLHSCADLASHYMSGFINYDQFVGQYSIVTSIDIDILTNRLKLLCTNEALRKNMGDNGFAHVKKHLDWAQIIPQYNEFSNELSNIRNSTTISKNYLNPYLSDPIITFKSFSSNTVPNSFDVIKVANIDLPLFVKIKNLRMFKAFQENWIASDHDIELFLHSISANQEYIYSDFLKKLNPCSHTAERTLLSLEKFNIINISFR